MHPKAMNAVSACLVVLAANTICAESPDIQFYDLTYAAKVDLKDGICPLCHRHNGQIQIKVTVVDWLNQFVPTHGWRVADIGAIDRDQLDLVFCGSRFRRECPSVVLFQEMA